jgi:hypothetical protein
MKVVFIIFGILALLGVAGGSALLTARNSNEISSAAESGAINDMASALAESMLGSAIPDKGAWQTAQIFSILALLLGIFGFIGLFMKGKVALIAAAGVAIGTIVLWIVEPSFDAGAYGGANPKSVAMIIMVNGIIAAGCIFGAANARNKNAAAS